MDSSSRSGPLALRPVRLLLCLVITLLLLSAVPRTVFGEDSLKIHFENPMQNLLTEHTASDCADYAFNARRLIPQLYDAGNLDSVYAIMSWVDSVCANQYFTNFRGLLAMRRGERGIDICDSLRLAVLLQRYGASPSLIYWGSFDRMAEEIQQTSDYFDLIKSLADEVADNTEPGSYDHAAALYAGNRFEEIRRGLSRQKYSGTCLQQAYDRVIDSLLDKLKSFRGHYALTAGPWFPTGNASVLGTKAEIGAILGARYYHWGFDVTGGVRFLESEQTFQINKDGEIVSTNGFLGGWIDLVGTYELFPAARNSVEFFAGGGYDGFDALNEEHRHEGINSYRVTMGLNLRRYLKPLGPEYIGLQVRYNITDYRTGATDLSGNSVSVHFVFGGLNNRQALDALERLQYRRTGHQ